MKRPSWATHKMYKGVSPISYTSLLPLSDRGGKSGTSDRGTILTYTPGTIVVSPNGVSIEKRFSCARGIHAFTNKRSLHDFVGKCYKFITLTVYASKWHGHGHKVRARRVWVGRIIKEIQ